MSLQQNAIGHGGELWSVWEATFKKSTGVSVEYRAPY